MDACARLSRAVLAAGLLVLPAGCPESGEEMLPLPDGPASFVVMTQNLYLGADLFAALTPAVDLAALAEHAWASAEATDFRARAKLVADAIESSGADLVALQEVALWRKQEPGDGSPIPNATVVAHDFLEILVDELGARGLDYRAVVVNQNGDAELTGTSGNDYRLTDRDAVLAKETIHVVSTYRGIYPIAHLATIEGPPLSPGGQPVSVRLPRGWVTVDFRAGGKTIRLLNTHLEALSRDVAALQAADAIAIADPSEQPTVVAGDMNLIPDSAGYATFVAQGTDLSDAWTATSGAAPGYTCCFTGDLLGGDLAWRIDLVFATSQLHPEGAQVVTAAARTPGNLHASDHAGVVVGFTVLP